MSNIPDYLVWIGALAIYQAYATALVAKSDYYTDSQKVRQVLVIWLIPLLGAILARSALNVAARQARQLAAEAEREKRSATPS